MVGSIPVVTWNQEEGKRVVQGRKWFLSVAQMQYADHQISDTLHSDERHNLSAVAAFIK